MISSILSAETESTLLFIYGAIQCHSLQRTCHKERYCRIKFIVLIHEKPWKVCGPRICNLSLF